jgi:hypothetical protein
MPKKLLMVDDEPGITKVVELHSNPDIDATDIAVTVKNGIVALTGYVRATCRSWRPKRRPSAFSVLLPWRTT